MYYFAVPLVVIAIFAALVYFSRKPYSGDKHWRVRYAQGYTSKPMTKRVAEDYARKFNGQVFMDEHCAADRIVL